MAGLDAALAQAVERMLFVRMVRSLPLAIPAVGAEVRMTIPGGAHWEILNLFVNFSTSAVVANRTPRLQVEDGDTNVIARWDSNFLHPASTQVRYNFSVGLGYQLKNVDCIVGLPKPPFVAMGGWTLRTNTFNIDAGDAYGVAFLVAREISPAQFAQYYEDIKDDLGAYSADLGE